MSRLIDANALIIKPDFIFYGVCGTPVIRCEDLARIINEMPTIEPQKWIPVSEKFPEDEIDVLVCSDTGNVEIAKGHWDGEYTWVWPTLNRSRFGWAIAWMPLPEPWKGEEE